MSDKFKNLLSKILGKDPEVATEAELAEAEKQFGMKKCTKCGGSHADDKCMSSKKEDDEKAMAKAIQDALAPVVTKLSAIEADRDANVSLAKKAEIDALISEASKDGKIIPLDTADIYEVKDGKTTIKVEPSMLRKMLEKLPKGQVQLSRKEPVIPKQGDKVLTRGSAEWREFYVAQRERGAAELTHKFSSIN